MLLDPAYNKCIKDGSFCNPKLTCSFVDAYTVDHLDIVVKPTEQPDMKTKILHSAEDIKINVNADDIYKVGQLIAKAIDESDKQDFTCCLHIDADLESVAHDTIMAYYKFDAFINSNKQKHINFAWRKEFPNESDKDAYLSKITASINQIAKLCTAIKYLGDMPANYLRPSHMKSIAEEIVSSKKNSHLTVECIDQEIIKNKMGGLYNVGKASDDAPQMVIVKWSPKTAKKRITIVGKGITFDTGGLSMKPSNAMIGMKHDMLGSVNAMMLPYIACEMNLDNIEIISIMPCAENNVNANAMRPGDVIKIYDRKRDDDRKRNENTSKIQSVEVLNTDAEGRLVLADGIAYTQEHHKPQLIITVATLTGAILVALGDDIAGFFTDNPDVQQNIIDAAKKAKENLWQMPFDAKIFNKHLQSQIADIPNISTIPGRCADSSIAALFLKKFVDKGVEFAHFDIAGVAETRPWLAFKVLLEFIQKYNNQI